MTKAEPELSETGPVWPPGGGEVGALLRSGAWTATPLGPVERWPPRFRTLVELVLASPVASFLVCGPDRLLLYNDAAAWLHGGSLPAAHGRHRTRLQQHAPRRHGQPRDDNPHALPLGEFIRESMTLLAENPDAAEILVERVKPQWTAEATGRFEAVFNLINPR